MNTYEKKYKEALERARNLRKDAIDMGENLRAKECEIIFPELKESEDEKIRKALIRFHKSTIDIDGIKGADVIAWLEKQGEKKSQRMISAEAKEAMYDKPAWSKEDKDVINHLLAICNGAKKFIQFESCSREDIIKCQDWLTSLKERIE